MALSLVQTFKEADYPCLHSVYFTNPLNGGEISRHKENFRRAASLASIEDYRIFTDDACISAYFKKMEDYFLFSVALKPNDAVEVDYIHAEMDAPNRLLTRTRKTLINLTHAHGLAKTVRFEVDRENKCIAVFAKDGHSFINFDRAVRADCPDLLAY